jgi:hypothetical protein
MRISTRNSPPLCLGNSQGKSLAVTSTFPPVKYGHLPQEIAGRQLVGILLQILPQVILSGHKW